MQNYTIKVVGMSCSHCVNTVKNLIQDERGVESLEVSLETGIVTISGNEKMNKEQIINSINLSGTYHAE